MCKFKEKQKCFSLNLLNIFPTTKSAISTYHILPHFVAYILRRPKEDGRLQHVTVDTETKKVPLFCEAVALRNKESCLSPMTGHPAITTTAVLPMSGYPLCSMAAGLSPITGNRHILSPTPLPLRAYPHSPCVRTMGRRTNAYANRKI